MPVARLARAMRRIRGCDCIPPLASFGWLAFTALVSVLVTLEIGIPGILYWKQGPTDLPCNPRLKPKLVWDAPALHAWSPYLANTSERDYNATFDHRTPLRRTAVCITGGRMHYLRHTWANLRDRLVLPNDADVYLVGYYDDRAEMARSLAAMGGVVRSAHLYLNSAEEFAFNARWDVEWVQGIELRSRAMYRNIAFCQTIVEMASFANRHVYASVVRIRPDVHFFYAVELGRYRDPRTVYVVPEFEQMMGHPLMHDTSITRVLESGRLEWHYKYTGVADNIAFGAAVPMSAYAAAWQGLATLPRVESYFSELFLRAHLDRMNVPTAHAIVSLDYVLVRGFDAKEKLYLARCADRLAKHAAKMVLNPGLPVDYKFPKAVEFGKTGPWSHANAKRTPPGVLGPAGRPWQLSTPEGKGGGGTPDGVGGGPRPSSPGSDGAESRGEALAAARDKAMPQAKPGEVYR